MVSGGWLGVRADAEQLAERQLVRGLRHAGLLDDRLPRC
jgi:hypothetical protein